MQSNQRSKSLEKHLAQEHNQSPLAEYLKEIVYGGNDGIVTTFAVVAGFTGAQSSNSDLMQMSFLTVLLFGLANLFADGLSMGLGNYLSVRAEQDVFTAAETKERHEITNNPESEAEETIDILVHKGFSQQDAEKLTEIYKSNPDYWVDWMMHHELEMPNPASINPLYTGLATFLAFIFFGAIPLIPYLLFPTDAHTTFTASCIATFSALVLLGLVKWKVINQKLVRSVTESVLIGGTSAVVAYIVGIFFR